MKPAEEIILPPCELDLMNAVWDAEDALKRPVNSKEIRDYGSPYVSRIQNTVPITPSPSKAMKSTYR